MNRLKPDGLHLDLEFMLKDALRTSRMTASPVLAPGHTVMLLGHWIGKGRSLLIVITASVVDDHAVAPPKNAEPPALENGKEVQLKELSFDWLLGQANIRDTSNERVVSPAAAKSIDARKFELGNAPGVPRMVESESLKLAPGPARRALPNALAGSLSEALPSTTPDYATAIEINADSIHYDEQKNMTFAEGHAVFNDGKAKITDNALRYDPKKREVEVTGAVRIELGGNVATCEKIIYQLDTGKIHTVGPSKTTVQATPAR